MKRGALLLFLASIVIQARGANRDLVRFDRGMSLWWYCRGMRDGLMVAARSLKVRLGR